MHERIDWQRMNSIITVSNAQKDYLFSQQLEKVVGLCDEIVGSDQLKHESILGIVGERGSGKSSFLNTVKEKLSDEKYYVMDILDPSVFDDSMGIIELFVSQIYKFIVENEKDNYESAAQELHEQLQDIIKLLADFQVGKESFYRDNTYKEVLENVKQRVNMPQLIKKLVAEFLSYLNTYANKNIQKYKGIVLCIDDVDLVSNDKIYKLLEDVRKYLAGNVIVITAFHSMQLFDAILHEKLQENSVLINEKSITSDQVRNQVARYLEKLIPVNNRVGLYESEDLLKKSYISVLTGIVKCNGPFSEQEKKEIIKEYFSETGLPVDESISVREWVYLALSSRLRLKLEAVDNMENTIYNLPSNLRGLLQLIRLIVDGMDHISLLEYDILDKTAKSLCKDNADKMIKNLELYENYFCSNLSEVLPTDLRNIIEQWKKSKYNAKNYLVCNELLKIIEKKSKDALIGLPKYYLQQHYNISIGDVYSVIEVYKSVFGEKEEVRYFVYSLKVLYSVELLSNYLRACNFFDEYSADNKEALNTYLTLINAKIIPDYFVYFTENTNTDMNLMVSKEALGNPDAIQTCRNLFFSSVAVNSHIRRAIPVFNANISAVQRRELEQSLKARPYDTYKYGRLIDYDMSDGFNDLIDGNAYPIDPLAFVGQKWYVKESFFNNYYVFYSVFDIDALVRFNYGRGEGDKVQVISSLVRRLRNILSGYDVYPLFKKRDYEKNLIAGMSAPIFYIDALRMERHFVYKFDDKNEIRCLAQLIKAGGDNMSLRKDMDVMSLPKYKFKRLLEHLIGFENIPEIKRGQLTIMLEYYNNSNGSVRRADKQFVEELIKVIDYEFDADKL